jgi:hypothetical protein
MKGDRLEIVVAADDGLALVEHPASEARTTRPSVGEASDGRDS